MKGSTNVKLLWSYYNEQMGQVELCYGLGEGLFAQNVLKELIISRGT